MNDFDGSVKLNFWTIYDGGGFKYKLLIVKVLGIILHESALRGVHAPLLISWRNENWTKEKKYFPIFQIRSAVLSDSVGYLRIFDALDHLTPLMNSVFTATHSQRGMTFATQILPLLNWNYSFSPSPII